MSARVTLFLRSPLTGLWRSTEARLLSHGSEKWAQYNDAPFVRYIPKRCRKGRVLHDAHEPSLVIVEGWGHGLGLSSLGCFNTIIADYRGHDPQPRFTF